MSAEKTSSTGSSLCSNATLRRPGRRVDHRAQGPGEAELVELVRTQVVGNLAHLGDRRGRELRDARQLRSQFARRGGRGLRQLHPILD